MEIVASDLASGMQAPGIAHKVGRGLLLANFGEVRRVRAVVAADDEENVERAARSSKSASCRSWVAPQIVSKKAEVRGVAAVAVLDGRAQAARCTSRSRRGAWSSGSRPRHGEGSGRDRIPMMSRLRIDAEIRLVAAVADVVAHEIGLGEVEHDEVMPEPSPSAREAVARVSSCFALP